MFNEKETLLKDFENEIWLYIDGTLAESRKKYWQDKMNSFPELKHYYEQTIEILSDYDSNSLLKIENKFYAETINKAIQDKNNFLKYILTYFRKDNIAEIKKLSFASAMVLVLISLLLLLNKPIEKPVSDKSLLEWDSKTINEKLTGVENSVYLLKNDKSIDKIIYNYTRDGWNMARSSLEDQIKKIQKEINDNSL